MVLLGTVIPFWLVLASLTYLRASQASVVGMTEPLIAIAIAWVILGESMTALQIVGAFCVLGGVLLAERSR
jgi:drug/metabolite transporter (DMT)-like permease